MTEAKVNNLIKLNDVRLSFPSLFQPKDWKNDAKPRYEATFMLDKTIHANEIKLIQEQIDEILTNKKMKKPTPSSFLICLKDGDAGEREELKGHYYLCAKSNNRVPLLEKNPKIEVTDENRFYGGCYVSAYIQIVEYNKTGKGITAYLKSVQFRKDGERFGNSFHDISTAYDSVDTDEELEEDLF
jgi:hypothetical protein